MTEPSGGETQRKRDPLSRNAFVIALAVFGALLGAAILFADRPFGSFDYRARVFVRRPETIFWICYFALLGPRGDGKVKHSLSVYVPPSADLVRVKAWTGQTDSGCTSFEETETVTTDLRPGEQTGCLVLRLPKRAK
jgi:hypothetical protein